VNLIEKYEELNLKAYNDPSNPKLVFLKDDQSELKAQMDHVVENLKNPYEDMYHWCKGEIYDL